METLAKRLRSTRVLGPLSIEQIIRLLEGCRVSTAAAGDIVVGQEQPLEDHLLLLDGELEMQRLWRYPETGQEKSHTWHMKPSGDEGSFCFLGAAGQKVRVRAVTDARYLSVSSDAVDELLSFNVQVANLDEGDTELRQRIQLVKRVSIFHQLPVERVRTAFERMTVRRVHAGEDVITQGDEGDSYYIIRDGEAVVMRTDPFSDEVAKVVELGSGDAFGEEALLQGGYRNATVTMSTPGELLVLKKEDSDALIKPGLLNEIGAEEAREKLDKGEAVLVDCRYGMEYQESRIPGALYVPLNRLRWDIHGVDPDQFCIVYCRSGRRSRAAAFLIGSATSGGLARRGDQGLALRGRYGPDRTGRRFGSRSLRSVLSVCHPALKAIRRATPVATKGQHGPAGAFGTGTEKPSWDGHDCRVGGAATIPLRHKSMA